MNNATTLLEAKNLVKKYNVTRSPFIGSIKTVKAVNHVNLSIFAQENLGLVGESGCGKTTLIRMLSGLIDPSEGQVLCLGNPLKSLDKRALAKLLQPVFQDPYSSLNPMKTIHEILARPLKIHQLPSSTESVCELLERVGLKPGESFLTRYPHELSGGQRQRVAIARALSVKPKLILADEPVSGLDPTVQIQILKLMKELQETTHVTFVIVSHVISVVKSLCNTIAIMYLGKIVEIGPVSKVWDNPHHPYTRMLLRAFPTMNPRHREWIEDASLVDDIPSAIEIPSGCPFRTRCSLALPECSLKEPTLQICGSEHFVACPVVIRHSGSKLEADHEA